MRLIDAERFDVFDYEEKENGTFTDGVMMVLEAIDNAPTIEPCEDAISREAVRLIESDADAYVGDWNADYENGFLDAINKVLALPSVAPSRRGGDWIDLFEEIGNTYDTIGEGAETNAFNRGIEACAEIVRRFFGLDIRQEKR